MIAEGTLPFAPEDLSLLKDLVPGVNIVRVLVVSSSYSRAEILDTQPGLQMNVELVQNVTAHVSVEHKQAWAFLDLSVIATAIATEHAGSPAFRIDTRLEIRYDATQTKLEGDELQRGLNAMCHTGAPLHGWSFLRQHVHDAMSRMLLPPLDLPLLPNPMAALVGKPASKPSEKKLAPRPKKK